MANLDCSCRMILVHPASLSVIPNPQTGADRMLRPCPLNAAACRSPSAVGHRVCLGDRELELLLQRSGCVVDNWNEKVRDERLRLIDC